MCSGGGGQIESTGIKEARTLFKSNGQRKTLFDLSFEPLLLNSCHLNPELKQWEKIGETTLSFKH